MEEFNEKFDDNIDTTSPQELVLQKEDKEVGIKGNKYKSMVKLDCYRH